eukprot:sb/3474230/
MNRSATAEAEAILENEKLVRDAYQEFLKATTTKVQFYDMELILRDHLTCPVCHDITTTGLVLWEHGHIVCGRCRDLGGLTSCPLCMGVGKVTVTRPDIGKPVMELVKRHITQRLSEMNRSATAEAEAITRNPSGMHIKNS